MTTATARLPLDIFSGWLASGERGLSSEAIVTHLTGVPISGRRWGHDQSHPHDPSDFRRCALLLEAVPLALLTFRTMAEVSPQWARLVAAWEEIHALMEEECPGFMRGVNGAAPRSYALMRRTIAGGVKCETCNGTGRSEPCPKCKGTGRRSGGRCRARDCWRGFHSCEPCRGNGYTGGTR